MLPAKFSDIMVGDSFIYNHKKYIKIWLESTEILSCCNFPRKCFVNAISSDGKKVYFCENEDIILVVENDK